MIIVVYLIAIIISTLIAFLFYIFLSRTLFFKKFKKNLQ